MRFGGAAKGGVPGQRLGRCVRFATALAGLPAGGVDPFEELLPFRLPIAHAAAQQWPGEDDAPVAVLAADADVDELRVEHHAAEAFLQRLHRRAGIARPGKADRLHVDHRVGGLRHRLLQVAGGIHRQGQARIGGQRRQFAAGLPAAGLHLATVGVDRLDQLRLVGGTGGRCERQSERQYGQTRDAWDCHGNLLDLMAPMMRDSAARRRIRPEPGAGVAGSGRRFGERLHQPLDHRADPRGVAQVLWVTIHTSYGRRRSRCGQTRTSPSRSPMYSGSSQSPGHAPGPGAPSCWNSPR